MATIRENLLWVRTFDTLKEPRHAFLDLKRRYNEQSLIEQHGFKAQVRAAQLSPVGVIHPSAIVGLRDCRRAGLVLHFFGPVDR